MPASTPNSPTQRPRRCPGRPREAVPRDVAQRVFDWLCTGRPLTAFCTRPGNPSRRTIHDWRKKDPEFRRSFDLAREFGFWSLCDDVIMIADEDPPDGKLTPAFLARQRERIRVRFWLMSRWYPKGRPGPRARRGIQGSGASVGEVRIVTRA